MENITDQKNNNKSITKSISNKKLPFKKKEKQSTKLMKIIKGESFTNNTTGEVVETQTIQMQERDFNFDKIWLGHLIHSLDLIGNQKMKVVMYLLSQRNTDNIIIKTQPKMASESGVSKSTVSETILTLKESNFIKEISRGVYQINPDIIFKGQRNNRMNVLLQYQNIEDQKETETQIGEDPDTYLIQELLNKENQEEEIYNAPDTNTNNKLKQMIKMETDPVKKQKLTDMLNDFGS